jgi:hypothetical protein
MKAQRTVIATVLAAAMLFAGNALAAEKWMTGDLHQHTTFTDGSYPMNDLASATAIVSSAVTGPARATLYRKGVMPQGYEFGLDFQANNEHGGSSGKDNFNNAWTTYGPGLTIGDSGTMWRWQTLISPANIPGYIGPSYMGAADWIKTIRDNYAGAGKIAMTGMEWNPPGHEHSSSGIVAGNSLPIAEFEYRFDNSDTDGTLTTTTATTMGWSGKVLNATYNASAPDYSTTLGLNKLHNKTVDAVKWMQTNYPTTSYVIPAHVERAGCGLTGGAWNIAAFRDINDNAPTVAFGFEGVPGHEKSSGRGGFSASSCGGGTYGGAGTYVATVGGVWDNLLADGRKFWNIPSSDFHDENGADFWPGEYLKTYTKVKTANPAATTFTQEDVVNALRAGNSYTVPGNLISDLDYKVIFKTPFGSKTATMGETLYVKKGNKVTVQIKFKMPTTNNCQPGVNASANFVCPAPSVHHVQLIQGKVNAANKPKKLIDNDPTKPNTAYKTVDPTVASIVATFDNDQNSANPKWTTDAQGFTVMTFDVPNVQNDMFFRIRGSNLGYDVKKMSGTNVVYGTDAAGNPLKNTPGTNNADMAWEDLWFYSNPIFVSTEAPTQFVYTSDSHYGITRSAIYSGGPTAAQPVNKALVATINALPAVATPCDAGVNSCATAVNSIDFVANTGDVSNRLEGTGGVTATTIWGQFTTDYINGLTVKDKSGAKASLFLVPGNHDVSNAIGYPKAPMTTASNMDAGAYLGIYNLMMNPATALTNVDFVGTTPSFATAAASYDARRVHFSRDIGGVHFIFLGMWPDSVARTWMDSDLSSVSSTTPVVLFTHDQPVLETKHLISPAGKGVFNLTPSNYKFENLVTGEGANGLSAEANTTLPSTAEQTALATWLKNHKNIVAYFHGNDNANEFYKWTGPNGDISLNVFRVDSPMKGNFSGADPSLLSYQVISIDPAATQMTVREYRWNTKKWGAATTVSLLPRTN